MTNLAEEQGPWVISIYDVGGDHPDWYESEQYFRSVEVAQGVCDRSNDAELAEYNRNRRGQYNQDMARYKDSEALVAAGRRTVIRQKPDYPEDATECPMHSYKSSEATPMIPWCRVVKMTFMDDLT